MQDTSSLRTLLVLLVLLVALASTPAVAVDLSGGGGPPKLTNMTDENFNVGEAPGPAHQEGRLKGYRVAAWKGRCEVPACKGLYLGPAVMAQFKDLVFVREEPRPNGAKATRYVSRGGTTFFMVIEEAGGKRARVLQRFFLRDLWREFILEVASGRKEAGGWKFEKNPAALRTIADEYLKQLRFFNREHGQKIYEAVRWLESSPLRWGTNMWAASGRWSSSPGRRPCPRPRSCSRSRGRTAIRLPWRAASTTRGARGRWSTSPG